ncbi:MAG: hypothetical protein LAO23_19150 [Acidobacteriia bacterium]|nr:hypothetical protein [Terriglobia bacterium]
MSGSGNRGNSTPVYGNAPAPSFGKVPARQYPNQQGRVNPPLNRSMPQYPNEPNTKPVYGGNRTNPQGGNSAHSGGSAGGYANHGNTTPAFGNVPAPKFGEVPARQYPNQQGTVNLPPNRPTPQHPNGPNTTPVFGNVPAPKFGEVPAPPYPNQQGTVNPPPNRPTPQPANGPNTTPVFGNVPAPKFGEVPARQYPNQQGTVNPPPNRPTPQYPNGPNRQPVYGGNGPGAGSNGIHNAGTRQPRRICCAFPPNVKPVHSNGGGSSYTHSDGRRWDLDQGGQIRHFSKPGTDVRFADNGNLRYAQVARPDHSRMTIRRSRPDERVVEVVRADHSRVVVMGRSRGYLERPLGRPGYYSRTYVVEGRSYARVYRSYSYRHVVYYRYVPPVYYHHAFYGWAGRPWREPVVFGWGWHREPWYETYGTYLAPLPVYPSAALWLTDFLLAANLRQEYQNRQAVGDAPPVQPSGAQAVALTPEVKQAIAEEVHRQIQDEQAAASQSQPARPSPTSVNAYETAPPALDPNQRIFVVSSSLEVTTAAGECALSPGDIILRTADQASSENMVEVSVLSSKSGDCPANVNAPLELAALQEMQNQFREQIDAGLKTLAENGGQNGLPNAPAATPYAVPEGQATADPGASQTLFQQGQAADEAETSIHKQVGEE